MIVFIKNIPSDTVRSQIVDFVKPAVKRGLFRKSGAITDVTFLKLRDKRINLMEYHALVSIEPETAALRAIKKLHGQTLNGKRMTVRQYHKRSWHNDKRTPGKQSEMQHTPERRKPADRRRRLEVVEDEFAPQYSSDQVFHRIY